MMRRVWTAGASIWRIRGEWVVEFGVPGVIGGATPDEAEALARDLLAAAAKVRAQQAADAALPVRDRAARYLARRWCGAPLATVATAIGAGEAEALLVLTDLRAAGRVVLQSDNLAPDPMRDEWRASDAEKARWRAMDAVVGDGNEIERDREEST